MATVEVLAPGLLATLDAFPDAPAAEPLRRLLTKARRCAAAPVHEDAAVARLLGFECAADEPPALAAITAARDLGRIDLPRSIVRADPVHLRPDPTRLVVFDAASIALEAAEAEALVAFVNEAFRDAGFRLEHGTAPLRWYATLEGVERLRVPSPRALRGRAAESCLDALREAGPANRLMTEAQMVLAGAPVNAAREAAGKPPVNSLWLWGLGPPPAAGPARLAALVADDDEAAACAAYANVAHRPLAGALANADPARDGPIGVVAPVGPEPAALEAFERDVAAPARALLAGRRAVSVRITADGSVFDCGRFDRLAFWRRAPLGDVQPA